MKIHITNLYNFNKEDRLVQRQHKFADAARSLGFYEMGIFSYPVETDTASELSKRLDGVIAALEDEDVVIMQLPTRNGIKYEQLLFNKIKAYKNTKVAVLFHDLDMLSDINNDNANNDYMSLCKRADVVILPSGVEMSQFTKEGVENLVSCEDVHISEEVVSAIAKNRIINFDNEGYLSLCNSSFYVQKLLMDVVWKIYESQKELANMALAEPEDEIQIGFGLHDKSGDYSMWVGVTMQSIIEHTSSKICFHILHDDTLSASNREKLLKVASGVNNRIVFHYIAKDTFDSISSRLARYTIGTMFRTLLPEILNDLSKIIYLDADILFNRDIRELWNMDIDNYYLIAVHDAGMGSGTDIPIVVKRGDVERNCYFNAGVLCMNLNKIRLNGNMKEMVLDFLERTPEATLHDQDALNYLYSKETLLLDTSWNYLSQWVRNRKEYKLENKVYHYAASALQLSSLTEMDQLYYETIRRTPWGEEECRKLLKQAFERTNERINQLEKVIVQISGSCKKHIFYGKETKAMKNMYQLLIVREGDYRVLAEPGEETGSILPCKSLAALAEEKDDYVVFVLPEADEWSSIGRLEQMGLENEKDFFVIPRLLSPNQGGYI